MDACAQEVASKITVILVVTMTSPALPTGSAQEDAAVRSQYLTETLTAHNHAGK